MAAFFEFNADAIPSGYSWVPIPAARYTSDDKWVPIDQAPVQSGTYQLASCSYDVVSYRWDTGSDVDSDDLRIRFQLRDCQDKSFNGELFSYSYYARCASDHELHTDSGVCLSKTADLNPERVDAYMELFYLGIFWLVVIYGLRKLLNLFGGSPSE